MAALDAPTQPRIARSRQRRCPAPPPRRAVTGSAATVGVELPRTVQRATRTVAPTSTLLRPATLDEPEPEPEPEPRRSRRWIGVLVAALAGGLATGAALAVTGVGLVPTAKTGPTAAQALGAVQHLGPQHSAPQAVQSTFAVDQTSFLDVAGRIRYHAVGQAQATVDLTAVSASDIQIRGSRVTVRIPAAQLDPPAIDDTNSNFVNNRGRILSELFPNDLTPADVQPQAEQQLSDAAHAQGIPDAAQQLATARVRATLRHLGFGSVTVSVAGN